MTKIFQNIPKTLFWGPFWDLLAQIWAKIDFPGKSALSLLKYFNYLPKKLEKTHDSFLRKMPN